MLSYRPALDNPNYNEMETVLSLDNIPKEDLDDPFFMHYLLNEAYDLSYGIYDGYLDPHLRDQFGKIGVHPKEEITSGSLMDRWLKHFTQYGMAELFGMSFQEFISADVLTCVNMLETAKEAMRIKKKLYQELESPKGSKKDSGKKEGGEKMTPHLFLFFFFYKIIIYILTLATIYSISRISMRLFWRRISVRLLPLTVTMMPL